MKKIAIFLLCGLATFSIMSIRIDGASLFSTIDRHTYPVAVSTIKSAKKFAMNKWNNFRKEKKQVSKAAPRNKFGHRTYNEQEREKLLSLLTNASK